MSEDGGFDTRASGFVSSGAHCDATLYLPRGQTRPPVVVMAHGFAAERRFRLDAFAERFASRGLAVLAFDYRGFGNSEGTPRQLVCPRRHLQDWRSALGHVRQLPEIDPKRIGLWGSSFSGGHVLVTAARNPDVRAVVSQVPFVDAFAVLGALGPSYALRATWAGLRDLARMLTGRRPYRVPVVGRPGELAAMNTPDAMSGYLQLVPEGSDWENACPARIFLTLPAYRPIRAARRVTCPTLLVLAERDSLIPAAAVRRTAARLPRGELYAREMGHFDAYQGEDFEAVVSREADFLCRELETAAPGDATPQSARSVAADDPR